MPNGHRTAVPDDIEKDQEENPPPGQDSLSGKTLGGRYLLLEEIGAGGMGHVYRAHDQRLDRDVAIKLIHPWLASKGSVVKRFQNEAKLLAKLEHRSVLRTYGMGIEGDSLYLVMDLLPGVSLDKWLKERGTLDLTAFKAVFTDVLDGLAHAHDLGVLHRDIKPSNIVIYEDGDSRLHAMLLDFGLAKLLEAPQRPAVELTQSGELVGSPKYMSPEQAIGGTVDARCDIYALCCVMFEALSGEPPFAGDTPLELLYKHAHEVAPTLVATQEAPLRLAQIIEQGMEKDPAHRHKSVAQFQESLEQAYGNLSHAAPGANSGASPHRPRLGRKEKFRRHKWLKVLGTSLTIAVSIIGLLVIGNAISNESGAGSHAPVPASDTPSFPASARNTMDEYLKDHQRRSATQWMQLGEYAVRLQDQSTAVEAYLYAAESFADSENNRESARHCAAKVWSILKKPGLIGEGWRSSTQAQRCITVLIHEKDYDAARSMLQDWYEQSTRLKNEDQLCLCESLQARVLAEAASPQEALAKANACIDKLQALNLTQQSELATWVNLAGVAHRMQNAQLAARIAEPLSNSLERSEKRLGHSIYSANSTLALLLVDLKMYDRARKSLQAMTKTEKNVDEQIKTLRQLGSLEMSLQRFAAAEAYFKKTLALIDKDGISSGHEAGNLGLSYQLIGKSLLAQNKDEEARTYFEKANRQFAIALPPGSPYNPRLETYSGLLTLAQRRNDQAEAQRWRQLITQVEKERHASKKKVAAPSLPGLPSATR